MSQIFSRIFRQCEATLLLFIQLDCSRAIYWPMPIGTQCYAASWQSTGAATSRITPHLS